LAGQTAFASVSALLFFNLGGLLGEGGWRLPFWAYGAALLMFALVWKFTAEPAGDMDPAPGIAKAPRRLSWSGFPWGNMAIIAIVTVYGSIFFYTVQIQAPSGLAELGLSSPVQRGFLTSIASLGVPLGTYVYSRIAPKWSVARLLLGEFALLSIGFLLMGKAGGVAGFLIGCFINQFGAGLLLPTLLVWSMSILSFDNRGRGTGFWPSAFALGQFLSPVVVTLAGHRGGGLLNAFVVLAVLAVGGAAVAIVAACSTGVARIREVRARG
jgi:MFS family permease